MVGYARVNDNGIEHEDIKVVRLSSETYKKHKISFVRAIKKDCTYINATIIKGRSREGKGKSDKHTYILRMAVKRKTKAEAFKDMKNIINNIIAHDVDMWVFGFVPKN